MRKIHAAVVIVCSVSLVALLSAQNSPTNAQNSSTNLMSERRADGRRKAGGEYDAATRREQWFRRGREGQPGTSAAESRQRALRQKWMANAVRAFGAISGEQSAAPALTGPAWRALGPAPILSSGTYAGGDFDYGPVTGRVTSIAVDPADPTGNTVYAGAATGGLWKSTNAAAADPAQVQWTPLLDQQPSLAVGSIALQPGNSKVILVGTGELNLSTDSYYSVGVLRSEDGGKTWSQIQTAKRHPPDTQSIEFLGLALGAIAFSTDNPNLVVMGAGISGMGASDHIASSPGDYRQGIYYSTDAGKSWTEAVFNPEGQWSQLPDGTSVTSIVYSPTQHRFYAAKAHNGFYWSSDGQTWGRLPNQPSLNLSTTNCPASGTYSSCPMLRGQLALRVDTDELFAWFINLYMASEGVFRSVDGGASWLPLASSAIYDCGDSVGCNAWDAGFYALTLAAVPNGAATDVYAGATNLYKCSVGPDNPQCVNFPFVNLTHVYGCSPVGKTSHIHPYQHAIDYARGSNIVFFGNDGGLYRASDGRQLNNGSCAGSNPFESLNGTLGSLSQFVWFSQHPTDPATLLGGTQGNGSPATAAAGSGLAWQDVYGGDGGYNAIDPNSPGTWYASHSGASIARCSSGPNCRAGNFQAVVLDDSLLQYELSRNYHPTFILDPGDPSKMILGSCRVWRGPSAGGTGWTPLSSQQWCSSAQVSSLAASGPVTASGSQILVAGFWDGSVSFTFAADSGVWYQAPLGPPVSSVTLDSGDASNHSIYTTHVTFTATRVRHCSLIAGANLSTCTDISGDLPNVPVNSLVLDPDNPNVIYVGTDIGVFVTVNNGVNWTEVAPGSLPEAPITRLAVFNANGVRKLRAATYGRGVWDVDMLINRHPIGSLESNGSVRLIQGQPITISGWAADPDEGAPVSRVEVLVDGVKVGEATLGRQRSDIADAWNRPDYLNSGWTYTLTLGTAFVPGPHTVTASAYDSANFRYDLPNSLTIILGRNQPPVGNLEYAGNAADRSLTVAQNGSVSFSGWAADNEDGAPLAIRGVALLDATGAVVIAPRATAVFARPDVVTANGRPDWLQSGFEGIAPLYSPGSNAVPPGTYTAVGFAQDSLSQYVTFPGNLQITLTAAPILEVPAAVDFSEQVVGLSTFRTLSVTSRGGTPITITGVSVTGDYSVRYEGNCYSWGQKVTAGNSCDIPLAFKPTQAGARNGTLTLTTAEITTPFVVNFTGTGLSSSLRFDPPSLDFGTVPQGVHKKMAVTVTNVSSVPVKISSITSFDTLSHNCDTILPGAGCQLELTITWNYRPGTFSSQIVLTDDGAGSPHTVPYSVTLTAAPNPTLGVTSVSFPDTRSGQQSSVMLTLSNQGAATFHIASITTTGEYSQTSTCGPGWQLAEQYGCGVTVTFAPLQAGTKVGTLVVNGDSSNSPLVAQLTGNAYGFGLLPDDGRHRPAQHRGGLAASGALPAKVSATNQTSPPEAQAMIAVTTDVRHRPQRQARKTANQTRAAGTDRHVQSKAATSGAVVDSPHAAQQRRNKSAPAKDASSTCAAADCRSSQ